HVSPTTIESSFWPQVIHTTRRLQVIPTCGAFGRGRPRQTTVSHHENTLRSGATMTTTSTRTHSEDKMMSPRPVLVASSTLSNLGDGVQLAAMPLLALLAENSALSTGVVVFARIVPAFILAAPIGVLVDHFNRFLVAVAENVIRIAALILFSTLW